MAHLSEPAPFTSANMGSIESANAGQSMGAIGGCYKRL